MKTKKRMSKGQAALEYITTYGWAILAGILAVGAMAYFGFLSPTKLLPNECSFGKQLECSEFRIVRDGANARADVFFRNNFGKPINISAVEEDAEGINIGSPSGDLPITIDSGAKQEIYIDLIDDDKYSRGDKRQANIMIRFHRSDIDGAPVHNLSGYVFTTVMTP
ncbi:hypothetical protein JXB28_05870 [Candidatus Woesearchaeota archaeon]|nr:hypothetical protein [Candidatus Woesearchaeota archaeon]